MPSVLFVCTGNMYRSPLAAEIFRGLLLRDSKRSGWEAGSAGTWTIEGAAAPRGAVEIARELGVRLEGHRARLLNRRMMEEYDLIVTMEEGQREALQVEFPFARGKIRLLAELAQGMEYDIADPAASPAEARAILREVADLTRMGYENICATAEALSR